MAGTEAGPAQRLQDGTGTSFSSGQDGGRAGYDQPQLQQDGNVTSVGSGQDGVKTGVGQDESGTGGGRPERGGHYGELPEHNR